ncbi:ATP-grasp domain-containing protein [Micromonospora sp. B11E3]|uniref:ATP-grasp domain-containing protein n=1 Tax=Micromonospora sp. B11E3 TaxID=3153562 RepID=UPI00325C62CB
MTSSHGTLLLVGAVEDTVRKAKALGLRVLLLQHPTKMTSAQQDLADVVRIVDYTDWSAVEPLVRQLWHDPGFDAALSLTEPGLEPAGRINDRYDLGGTGYEVAHLLRDKWAMRRHLAAAGVPSVAAAPLTERADLDRFGAEHGAFIVKPVDGTASFGVFLVRGPQDADEVWARVQKLRGKRTDRGSTLFLIQDFIMEQYVDGPELSVECFSFAGRHVVVAVTEKFVAPGFAEVGHVVPARLPHADQEAARRYVRRFLAAVGLRDGVSHTEMRIGPDGPVVIESHNRIAGDAIPELVEGAYGVDLTTYALGWPFGLVPELSGRPRERAAACTRFLVAEPGRIGSVEGVEDAGRLPDVLTVRMSAHPGDVIRELRDNWDRLGLVAVTAPDPESAIRRGAAVLREHIRVRTVSHGGRPGIAQVAVVDPAVEQHSDVVEARA